MEMPSFIILNLCFGSSLKIPLSVTTMARSSVLFRLFTFFTKLENRTFPPKLPFDVTASSWIEGGSGKTISDWLEEGRLYLTGWKRGRLYQTGCVSAGKQTDISPYRALAPFPGFPQPPTPPGIVLSFFSPCFFLGEEVSSLPPNPLRARYLFYAAFSFLSWLATKDSIMPSTLLTKFCKNQAVHTACVALIKPKKKKKRE